MRSGRGGRRMNPLVVHTSLSPHHNTRQVGEAMAAVLGAELVPTAELATRQVVDRELVGFGSGVYSFTFHPQLWRLVAGLRAAPGATAFVFSTSGGAPSLFWPSTRLFIALLKHRGYHVLGHFSCRGAYDWERLPLRGGNQGRPDAADLQAARAKAAAWMSTARQRRE